MHAVLFTKDSSRCVSLIAGLRHENIKVDVVTPSDHSHKRHLYTSSNIFLFHQELSTDDIAFMSIAACVKPGSVMVLLDPIHPGSYSQMDLVFLRPFSYAVIALHIQKKVVEKREKLLPRELQVGSLRLDLHKRLLVKEQFIIPLKNKEFLLLQFFFLNEGKILSRSDLLEYVWDRNASLATNTVDVHVSRLRNKLKLCDADQRLQTVPCVGYLWSTDSI